MGAGEVVGAWPGVFPDDVFASEREPVRNAEPTVSADVLTILATVCRDHERLRFDYRDHTCAASLRIVEPHRLVHGGRRWYLVAWDVERSDWRTFRGDRIEPRTPTGPRFSPRELPGDVAEHVRKGVSTAGWRHRATVRLHTRAAAVADHLHPAALLEPLDDHTCQLRVGADSLRTLAFHIAGIGVDFDIIDPPELRTHLRELAARCQRSADL